jgi:hypothetical protein
MIKELLQLKDNRKQSKAKINPEEKLNQYYSEMSGRTVIPFIKE